MNNNIIKGYVMLALKNMNYKEKEIEKILDELDYQFDIKTEYEAEKYYLNKRYEN